jgi:hypothetical protein
MAANRARRRLRRPRRACRSPRALHLGSRAGNAGSAPRARAPPKARRGALADHSGERTVQSRQIAGVGNHGNRAASTVEGGRDSLREPRRPILARQRRPHRPGGLRSASAFRNAGPRVYSPQASGPTASAGKDHLPDGPPAGPARRAPARPEAAPPEAAPRHRPAKPRARRRPRRGGPAFSTAAWRGGTARRRTSARLPRSAWQSRRECRDFGAQHGSGETTFSSQASLPSCGEDSERARSQRRRAAPRNAPSRACRAGPLRPKWTAPDSRTGGRGVPTEHQRKRARPATFAQVAGRHVCFGHPTIVRPGCDVRRQRPSDRRRDPCAPT